VGGGAASDEEREEARAAGRTLAELGAVVVCGGRGGVMEAACRGAKEAGGTTVGILPGLDRGEANAYVDVAIATGLGEARNVLVVRAADALVAVGGEWGTLTEIAFALKAGKTVAVVGSASGSWKLEAGPLRAASGAEAAELAFRAAVPGP
jgi:uncharacterized protein (TIGR00725 family)